MRGLWRENIVHEGAEETEGLEEFYKPVGAYRGNGSGVTQKRIDSQLTENDYQLQYGTSLSFTSDDMRAWHLPRKSLPKHANAQPLTHIV